VYGRGGERASPKGLRTLNTKLMIPRDFTPKEKSFIY